MCSLTRNRPMIFLVLLSIASVTLVFGGIASVIQTVRRRRNWQARERRRIETKYLEQTRRRQRRHDFLMDQALLSGAFTERKNGGD